MELQNRAALLVIALVAGAPTLAYAEPRPSGSHLPLLWLIVLAGAALAAMVPVLIKRYTKADRPGWMFWVASIVLAILFLIFVGPLIIGLGSILITGRTM